ncbi:hypothetical protein NXV03_00490 (plasmid) [Phocaeicola vulgatus]|nr:hypothetical protein [Phocaeicola vulgatus]
MRTMRKINKPIKFFGLSSGQFAIFMLLTAIIIIVSIFKQSCTRYSSSESFPPFCFYPVCCSKP